jgi:hypothetical protein
MALNAAQVEQIFKDLGKLVYITNQADSQATGHKKAVMAFNEQAVTGVAADYLVFEKAIQLAHKNTADAIKALTNLPAKIDAVTKAYINNVIPSVANITYVDLLSTIDHLRSQMIANGQYVAAGFNAYFTNRLDYNTLPTVGSSAIPDAWITDNVI